ncbi:MAG: hypothetical protein Q9M22_06395 [Mariprofundaceae bacterium]|nr:hypothetical protein [Mariprofundaceae bacterium]
MNPFSSSIVIEPRQLTASVRTLNQHVLDVLQERFQPLLRTPCAEPKHLEQVQFISSPQPWYGKSHLIGRLFQELRGKASLIYLRPFENPGTCWSSLLIKTIQELEYPDREGAETQQLEELSHALLQFAFAHLPKPPPNIIASLSLASFRENIKCIEWVDRHHQIIIRSMKKHLFPSPLKLRSGVSLQSWLSVLFRYAYFPHDDESRENCLDWLKGNGVDSDWAKKVGVRPPDNPKYDLDSSASNELCKNRLFDLCQLASFFRPFLFCFDQTENYAKDTDLARCFGIVLENMVAMADNQMTLMTSNQASWLNSIKPHWEEAHQHRISPSLELEGMNIKQAQELLQQRLGELPVTQQARGKLIQQGEWLNDLFAIDHEISVRVFLRQCDEQWSRGKMHTPIVADAITPPPNIADEHQQRMQSLLQGSTQREKKAMRYNPDVFQWLLTEVASAWGNVVVDTQRVRCFSCCWQESNQSVYFGLEDSSHHLRWRMITRAAVAVQQSKQQNVSCLVLRTPDLPPIPKPSWAVIGAEINAAQQHGALRIVALDAAQTASIYSAYALYLDVREGNLPHETVTSVLAFVRTLLTPLWLDLRTLPTQQTATTQAVATPSSINTHTLAQRVAETVCHERFMALSELVKRMQEHEGAVVSVINKNSNIKLHRSPEECTVQWHTSA